MGRRIGLILASAVGVATPASAQQAPPAATTASATPEEVAAMFGAREQVQQISLSPDGQTVAVVRPSAGQSSVLAVAHLNVEHPDFQSVLRATGAPDRLRDCRWISNERLICRVFISAVVGDNRLGFTRLIAVDSDGRNVRDLNPQDSITQIGFTQNGGALIDYTAGAPNTVLVTHDCVPEAATGTRLAQARSGLGVDRLDTRTMARLNVEPARDDAIDYLSDGHGTVRIMATQQNTTLGRDTGRTHYYYRRRDSREWLPLGDTSTTAAGQVVGFTPVAIDADIDAVYGFDAANGHTALFKMALDGSRRREMVFARPTVDIDDVLTVGRQQRVVGAGYVEDRRQAMFFDPALQRLSITLGRAIPNLPLVTFLDASEDGNTLLLLARGDTDPGRYFLLDRSSHRLSELLPSRPQLEPLHLAPVRAVTYPAADGTRIPGYLTLPPGSDGRGLPGIVLPHGGPEARDEWGFDWLAQFLAQRGFAVLQPNFRGSTGYGDDFFQRNGFQSWQTAVSDIGAGGRWLVAQGIARPDALAILGWSYGGYAALQSQVVDPELFRAVVAVAPVTDLDALRQEFANFTSRDLVSARLGDAATAAAASPARHAGQFRAPVLLFHGVDDRNVAVGESRLMAARLRAAGKSVDVVEFPGLDHQIEDSRARTQMLTRIDGFLRTSLHLTP